MSETKQEPVPLTDAEKKELLAGVTSLIDLFRKYDIPHILVLYYENIGAMQSLKTDTFLESGSSMKGSEENIVNLLADLIIEVPRIAEGFDIAKIIAMQKQSM